jgi:hypothetical protein
MSNDAVLVLGEILICAGVIMAMVGRAGARRSALLDAAEYCRLCGYNDMATDLEHWAGIQPGADVPHDDAIRRRELFEASERAYQEQLDRYARSVHRSEPPSAR